MSWLSEVGSAVTIVGLLIVFGTGFGSILRARLLKLPDNSLLIDWAIGWGAIGYSIYLIGLLGLLHQSVILAMLAGIICISISQLPSLWLRLRENIRHLQANWSLILVMLWLITSLFVGMGLVAALAPAIKFDDLWYHLTEAKIYILDNSIRPHLPPGQLGQSSVTPRLIEMLYTFTLSFNVNSPVAAKLVHFSLGVGGLLGVGVLGSRLFNVRTASLSMLFLASTPVFMWLMQTAYIDLGVLFFGVIALIALETWKDKKTGTLFGIVFGLFLATKLWVLLFIPGLIFAQIVRKFEIKEIARVFSISFIVFVPWLIEAFIATGNPIYPVFSSQTDAAHLGGAASVSDWFTRVYWQTFMETATRVIYYLIPWLSVLVLALLAPKKIGGRAWKWFLFGLVLIICWSIIPVRDERYMLVFAIPLYIVVGRIVDILFTRPLTTIAVVVPMVGLLFFLSLAPAARVSFYSPVVFGQQSKAVFLYENVGKNIWGCLDTTPEIQKALINHKKVLVFCHNMFYLESNFEDGLAVVDQLDAQNPNELVLKIKEAGFTHVLTKAPAYSLTNITQGKGFNISPDDPFFANYFEQRYTSKVDNTTIYEIK